MSLNLENIGTETAPSLWTWLPRDCSLYALALGADFNDRALVLDDAPDVDLLVYPTFMLALLGADAETREDDMLGAGDFTGRTVVLGEQTLEIPAPLKPTGEVQIVTKLADILDKGSGALVVLEAKGTHPRSGELLFTASMNLFVVGEGGFGGSRGPSRAKVEWPPRPPDHVRTLATLPIHSLLYRHAGNDSHGIHVDPVVARSMGFAAPILTGHNNLGIACRAIANAVADSDPSSIISISGRFAASALNGDLLSTEIWLIEPGHVLFRVINQNGLVIVDGGDCKLTT